MLCVKQPCAWFNLSDPERSGILNVELARVRAEQQGVLKEETVLRNRQREKDEYERKKRYTVEFCFRYSHMLLAEQLRARNLEQV